MFKIELLSLFGSMEGRGGEGRNFNGGEDKGSILVKYVLGLKERRGGEKIN